MKAVALSQMRRADALDPTPPTSAAADGPTVQEAPSAVTPPVNAAAVSSSPATIESTQREPFPLPSIS
jgi:hypothetical protein